MSIRSRLVLRVDTVVSPVAAAVKLVRRVEGIETMEDRGEAGGGASSSSSTSSWNWKGSFSSTEIKGC